MYEDDLEEETLQADAEPLEKEMINRSPYLAERCDDWRGTEVSSRTLTLRCMTREKFLDVSDEKMSDEDGCLSAA